jgi:predicted Zn-dependent protease
MGEVYAEQEHYPEAIEQYHAALAKRPDAQGMHFAIGVAYWAQQRMDLAEKAFQDAWKENPKAAMTNLYLGDIAVKDQRFSDALPFLLVTEHVQPRMLQVHVLLGQCYQSQHKLEEAKAEFQDPARSDSAHHFLLANVCICIDARASRVELSNLNGFQTEKEKCATQSELE